MKYNFKIFYNGSWQLLADGIDEEDSEMLRKRCLDMRLPYLIQRMAPDNA